jgi:thiamine-phosphate pyrophosphorylase
MEKEIFRIIDVNFNRSREGLRVCEDIARFILNSPKLTKDLKATRHKISDILKDVEKASRDKAYLRFKHETLFESRDSEADIGRVSKFRSEMKRLDVKDIFTANMERVKESLRSLEEFFKLIDKKVSTEFSTLRFKVYDIEKKAVKRVGSLRNSR